MTVADACPTCEHADDLDLSQAAFDQIATEKEGEVPSKSKTTLVRVIRAHRYVQSPGRSSTKRVYTLPHFLLSVCLDDRCFRFPV